MHKHKHNFAYFLHKVTKEGMDFILVFGGIFVLGMMVLNRRVVMYEVQDLFDHQTPPPLALQSYTEKRTTAVSSKSFSIDMHQLGKQVDTHALLYQHHLDDYLQQKVAGYQVAFNTQIPGKRIIIPAIGVDAPIVDAHISSPEQLEKGDFNDELKKWVVKYPFTSEPGQQGNTLLFGHSSVDGWEYYQQKYGYIFYKLPKLAAGDEIIVLWNGHRYTYEVDTTTITRPQKVGEEIAKSAGEHTLTLMACYPLLSDAKRILVKAKQTNRFPQQLSMK
jgi:LPXTG-site transpeptidase (sortase) family protein